MNTSVSVVIPVRDRGTYLARAVHSALKQTLVPDQVIVVDDGSFPPIIDSIQELKSQIKLIRYEKGINANYARNRGIEACQSKHIAFLDSDDWWDEDHLANALEKFVNSDLVGLFGAYHAVSLGDVSSDAVIRPKVTPKKDENPSTHLFISGGSTRTSTMVFLTDIARVLMFDEALKKHQDWDFIIRAQQIGGIGFNAFPDVHIDHGAQGRMSGATNVQATEYFAKKNRKILNRREYIGFLLRTARHAIEKADCIATIRILGMVDERMTIREHTRYLMLRILAFHKFFPECILGIYRIWRPFLNSVKRFRNKISG